ncbi:hypothetical protein [Pseudomonas germanica]|uniref:Uncharacterized protein n=1 Tax=Pseudomonas germanica TaxID=2815720 RepID=A0ABX8YHS5_9PSED|nr:hypothetical protein [Pseudomonas germanica]QYY79491.1 hypothetical protein J0G10_17250 [Pseudomonas germanica]
MAMITLKIQADRVKATQDQQEAWIAVKLCAEFTDIQASELELGAHTHRQLLPWHWTTLDPSDEHWTPHSKDAWQAWLVVGSGVQAIQIKDAVSKPAPVIPSNFLALLDKAADAIAIDQGLIRPESLVLAPLGAEADMRGTVPGFVERLSAMPHPVPCNAKVHALLAVDLPIELDDEAIFIVAPRVNVAGNLFDRPVSSPKLVEGQWTFDYSLQGRAICQASLPKKRLVHDGPSGRIINLYEQLVAIQTDHDQSLPSADRVAALPQALADAMDPLARIISVLPRAMAEWLAADHDQVRHKERLKSLEDDLAAPTSTLCRALDFIGLQVLAQRYDAVGRFEVPLIQHLEGLSANSRDAALLLKDHLARLPAGDANAKYPAAVRSDHDYLEKLLEGFSIFTPSSLRVAAGLSVDVQGTQPFNALDSLKRLWASPGPEQTGTVRGLRDFTLAPTEPADAQHSIRVERVFRNPPSIIDPGQGSSDVERVLKDIAFESVRSSMSMAYAAPFIEGLVSGRTHWGDVDPAGSMTPLAERFEVSMRSLLLNKGNASDPNGLYLTLATQAKTASEDFQPKLGTLAPELGTLIDTLMEFAGLEAIKIARKLGSTSEPFDRITPLPLPLTLQVDQFRTFSRHLDDWTRMAGYGLILGREDEAGDVNPVSLNRSTLTFGGQPLPPVATGGELQVRNGSALHDGGFLIVRPDAQANAVNWVDPNPYPLSDQIGVSDAVAEYANSWLTAPMPGEALIDQGTAAGVAAARFLAGAPPPASDLPALSFGYRYKGLGHLPLNGAVLAHCVRHKDNPYLLDIQADRLQLLDFGLYLRTVGIGGPTIIRETATPLPGGVALLADELPLRASPVKPGQGGIRCNYDHENGESLTDWPGTSTTETPGLRFEWVVTQGPVELAVTVSQNVRSDDKLVLHAKAAGAQSAIWFRLDVFRDGSATLSQRDCGTAAEDELGNEVPWTSAPSIEGKPWEGDGVYLTLVPDQIGFAIEMAGITGLLRKADGSIRALTKTPQAVAGQRTPSAAILLNGLGTVASNGIVPTSASLRIKGPWTNRHCWERWTNVALFAKDKQGLALKPLVIKTLNRLQEENPPSGSRVEEGVMPDPAVGGLYVELWEVFPKREQVDVFFLPALSENLMSPEIQVRLSTNSAGAAAALKRLAEDRLEAVCPAGKVLELRTRAAIDPDARAFGGFVPNGKRLGKAVLETLSREKIKGKDWLMGPAAVQPIEVATELMPELMSQMWSSAKLLKLRSENERRVVDLTLAPGLFGNEGRQRLRYCASVSLLPQRWSWRGRPLPPTPNDAWIGRRDTDTGLAATGTLAAVHALAVSANASSKTGRGAVAVSRDLDWRGGWNLWRFGVRLTSRYAALFSVNAQSSLDLHLLKSDMWLKFPVQDENNGREIAKPALALILPLTEQDMDEGVVPPIMAIFNGAMHQNGHFGDRLAVSVETVRHPYPYLERDSGVFEVQKNLNRELVALDDLVVKRTECEQRLEASDALPDGAPQKLSESERGSLETEIVDLNQEVVKREVTVAQLRAEIQARTREIEDHLASHPTAAFKYLPEAGPDPVRTGASHDGSAVPLRLDGPIGFGFDVGFEAGRFNHSAMLVSPDRSNLSPWSMLKIKFRRMEDPQGLKNVKPALAGPWAIKGHWLNDPGLIHEGLIFTQVLKREEITLKLGFPIKVPNPNGPGRSICIGINWVASTLTIGASVLAPDIASASQPNAAFWKTDDAGDEVTLRLIVSQKPKPTQGAQYRPAGEVVVELLIGDTPQIEHTGYPWLTLFTLPFEAQEEIDIDQSGQIILDGTNELPVPVRLSDYANAVWCQVSVASSRFDVRPSIAEPTSREWKSMSVDSLLLTSEGTANHWHDLCLFDKQLKCSLVLRPGIEDTRSEVEEICIAILSTEVHDISGRLKEEQFLAAQIETVTLPGNKSVSRLGHILWHSSLDEPVPTDFSNGRVRFVRTLIRRGTVLPSLEKLFEEPMSDLVNMNPADARGMMLSLSKPACWKFHR